MAFQKKAPIEATERNEPTMPMMKKKAKGKAKKPPTKNSPAWAGVANKMLGKSC